MQSIEMLLARLQGDERQSHRDPQGVRGESLRAVRQQARGRFQALADRLATIRKDTSRSPVGIQQAITELVSKVDLGFLDVVKTEAAADVSRYSTMLVSTPKSEKEPVLAFLSEQEIRRKYELQSAHVILMAFQLAVKEGKHEVIRAFLNGPLGSLVDEEFARRAMIEHCEKSQPLVYENYQQAVNLQEHLDSLADQATQVLQTLSEEAKAGAAA